MARQDLTQSARYESGSRGQVLIATMHPSHAANAAAKLVRDDPAAVGSPLHVALSERASEAS